jgi:hypothetical protein
VEEMSFVIAKDFLNKHLRALFTIVIVIVLAVYALKSLVPYLIPTEVPDEFYYGLILVFLLAILDQLIILTPTEPSELIFHNQADAMKSINLYIEKEKKTRQVDMLVCSASSMQQILYALLDTDCHIRVLMLHPKRSTDPRERDLIMTTYRTERRYFTEAGKGGNIEFAFYDSPVSIRGFCINDNLVGVGWYTYSRERSASDKEATIKITGARNPFIIAKTDSKSGKILHEFFRKAFDKLWPNRISAEEVDSWFNHERHQ